MVLTCLIVLWSGAAWAYHFSAAAPTGQTLYYNVVDGGAELVFPHETSLPAYGWTSFTKPMGALTVPDTVEWGGERYAVVSIGHHALYGCNGLSSLTVPEGVTRIGASAFATCSQLATVTLPSTLDTLWGGALKECSSLRRLVMRCQQPPYLGALVFDMTPIDSCVLEVPCGAESAYAAASPWNGFGQMVNPVCEGTLTVSVNDALCGYATGSGTYAAGIGVQLTAVPAEGCFFACWDDGVETNPRVVLVEGDAAYRAMLFAMRHDTVWLTDSVVATMARLSVLSADETFGIGVGSAVLPVGSEVEVCALPLEGHRFAGWDDGAEENPRRVTLTGDMTLTALFDMADVQSAEADWQVEVNSLTVSVSCPRGSRLNVYDAAGRLMFSTTTQSDRTHVQLPAGGVYLVQVDESTAKKVVAAR